jgi:hypothetical protein
MTRARSVKLALLLAAACAVCALASCSGDGVTTNCPALPLYQTFPLGDASIPDAASGDSTQSKAELAQAVSMNCATGVNGRGGPTNAGGTGGKAGGEGGSADDNAGAAGRK